MGHRHRTVCLTSALTHHGLIHDIPAPWDIAIPRGMTPPKLTNVRWRTFDRVTFTIGRELLTIQGTDRQVGLYSAERWIVDALRSSSGTMRGVASGEPVQAPGASTPT